MSKVRILTVDFSIIILNLFLSSLIWSLKSLREDGGHKYFFGDNGIESRP